MTATATESSAYHRTGAMVKSALGYGAYMGRNLNQLLLGDNDHSRCRAEDDINKLLTGYPRNHNYRVLKKKLFPSFRLYDRLRLVTRLYPDELESFLDVGCCRGFYVMDAAQRSHCRISVGIDIHEPFISTADRVGQYLGIENANFHLASLGDVAEKPEAYGGPFQTVLLIGTYHYLFWGSFLSSTAYYSHREILARLYQICTDRLIISARLEVDRLPDGIREKAKQFSGEIAYSTEDFLENAEEFFQIYHVDYLGAYPLFVMHKKKP